MGTQRTVLAVLAVVLVAATGLFGTLFVVTRGAAGDAEDQLTAVERELAETRTKAGDLTSDVDDLRDERDDLQATNDTLSACAEPTKEGIDAANRNDSAALDAAIDEMLAKCVR